MYPEPLKNKQASKTGAGTGAWAFEKVSAPVPALSTKGALQRSNSAL
jgi:hypothetical protein